MADFRLDDVEGAQPLPAPQRKTPEEEGGLSWGQKALAGLGAGLGIAGAGLAAPILTRFRAKPWAVKETQDFARAMRSRGIAPSISDLAPEQGFRLPISPSEPEFYRTPWLTRVQQQLEQAGEPTAVAMRRQQRSQLENAAETTLKGLEPPFHRPASRGEEISFRLKEEHGKRKKEVDKKWDDLRNTASTLSGYGKLPNVIPQRTYPAVQELLDTFPGVLGEIKNVRVKDALSTIAAAPPNAIGGGIPFVYSPTVHGPQLPVGAPPASRAGFDDLRRHLNATIRAFYGKPETAEQAALLSKVRGAIYDDIADWGSASGNKKVAALSKDAIDTFRTQIGPYRDSDLAQNILFDRMPVEKIPGAALSQPSVALKTAPLLGPGGQDLLKYLSAERALAAPGMQLGERPMALAKRIEKEEPLLRALLSPQEYDELAPLAQIAATLPHRIPEDAFQQVPIWRHPFGFLASKMPGSGIAAKAMYSPTLQNLYFRQTDPWARMLGRAGAIGGGLGGLGYAGYAGYEGLSE